MQMDNNISSSGDVDGSSIILKVQERPSFGLQNSSRHEKSNFFLKLVKLDKEENGHKEDKKTNMSVYLFITFVTLKG